jgi:NitT/TauT family transport system permease protein
MAHRFTGLFSVVVLLAGWALLALLLQSRYLPSPLDVWHAFATELQSGQLLFHVSRTFARVVAAFVIAMFLGTAIGFLLGRKTSANNFFDAWLILALNIPALVTIVFCYLWIGLTEVAAVAAVAINKIPNVAVTMREAARALDPQLDDVAKVFRLPPARRFRQIVWPQVEPYLAASVRNGLALIWKIVLVVELIGRSNGVGFQINLLFGNFELARLLAYALSFMVVVWLIETLLVKPWERRARKWRGEP